MKKAFTLIELLAVVLIIGILSAVALPQYQKAVSKTYLSNLLPIISSVKTAEEIYFLENGDYTKDWDSLSLSFPTSEYISLSLATVSEGHTINGITALDSRVSDVKLVASFSHNSGSWQGGIIGCYAKASNNNANHLCKSLTGKQTSDVTTGGCGGTENKSCNVYLMSY